MENGKWNMEKGKWENERPIKGWWGDEHDVWNQNLGFFYYSYFHYLLCNDTLRVFTVIYHSCKERMQNL